MITWILANPEISIFIVTSICSFVGLFIWVWRKTGDHETRIAESETEMIKMKQSQDNISSKIINHEDRICNGEKSNERLENQIDSKIDKLSDKIDVLIAQVNYNSGFNAKEK
jgi:hypothetical protein